MDLNEKKEEVSKEISGDNIERDSKGKMNETSSRSKDSNRANVLQEKERTDGRVTTPLPEDDDNRTLNEIKRTGQAEVTPSGTLRFVDKKTGIETRDYYHGLLPIEDLEKLLKQNGDFCVRLMETTSGLDRCKCLTVRWDDKIHNFVIVQTAVNTWMLDMTSQTSPQFTTAEGLIDFYAECKNRFSTDQCRLFTPVPRQIWEFRHAQIELKKKLGEGTFGEVYSGYVHKDNKRYRAAIKTIKSAHVTKKTVDDVMMEARIMRKLRHLNVVRFYGIAAEDEPLMMMMELIKGGSLDSCLEEKNDDITIQERLKMCSDVSDGLEYIHKKKILHRDVASRNCLYDERCVKISDFGMSRLGIEYVMGIHEATPIRWTAPEVLISKKFAQPSDVWSAGVLFWEIFNNGKEPYDGWSLGKVRSEVVKNNFRLSLPEWTPSKLKDMMIRIWASNPADRPTSEELSYFFAKMTNKPKPTICDITTTHDSTERRDEKKNPLFSITATMDTSIKRAKQTMGRRHPDKNSDESISKMSSLRHPVACKSKSDLSTESRSMRPSLRPPSSVHRVKSGLSIDAAEKSRQQHSKSKVSIDGLKTCRDPPTERKSKEQTKVHKTHIDRESKRIQVGESDSSRKKYKAKVRNTVDKSTRTLDESSANRKNRAKKKHPKKDRKERLGNIADA